MKGMQSLAYNLWGKKGDDGTTNPLTGDGQPLNREERGKEEQATLNQQLLGVSCFKNQFDIVKSLIASYS